MLAGELLARYYNVIIDITYYDITVLCMDGSVYNYVCKSIDGNPTLRIAEEGVLNSLLFSGGVYLFPSRDRI